MRVFENAKWIWINREQNRDEYGEFFASFSCFGKNAVCRLSCDGDYTLYINGRVAGSNQYGDFEHYKIYDEIDINGFLREGENTAAVLVWHFGEASQRYRPAPAGVIFEIVQQDKPLLVSDEKILCRKSRTYASGYAKKITAQLGFSFLYDAAEEDGWMRKGGRDFSPAEAVDKQCVFYPRPTEKLQCGALKKGGTVKSEGNYWLVDLGKETVGLPVLEFSSPVRQKITVFWGEDLCEGHVRGRIGDRNFSFEYIAKPGGNKYVNHMLRLGCRYLELYAEKPVGLTCLGVIPQLYPVRDTAFRPKEDADRRIYDLCVRTLKLSMMEHYVDTPWREQCLYAFDSRNQMLCGYYAFEGGNTEYARANLRLIGEDRREDGLLSICAPCGTDLTIPSFSLYYFMAVREYVGHTGDKEFAKKICPKLFSLIQVFIENRKEGLVCKFSGKNHWNFYDWSQGLEGRLSDSEEQTPDLVINCLFILALENLRGITEAAGLPFAYAGLLSESRTNTRKAFFDGSSGAYALTPDGKDFTSLGNALAILAGITENPEALCEKLAGGEFFDCSLSMKCFEYDALLLTDFEKWRGHVLNEIRCLYGKMLAAGATSVWETAEGARAFGNAGSLCHGWSAMPVYYYRIGII